MEFMTVKKCIKTNGIYPKPTLIRTGIVFSVSTFVRGTARISSP